MNTSYPATNWMFAKKNYALLFGLILGICNSVFGEPPPAQQWEASYHYDGNDRAVDMTIDSAGNIYVTGSTDIDFLTDRGIATVKYDPNGNQLWSVRYKRTNWNAGASALALDKDGNIYVTGYEEYYIYPHDAHYCTIKYDPNGNQLWVANDGWGSYGDKAYALALDNWSNVYVTGTSTGISTGHDYATVKYDTNGHQLWEARYDDPLNDEDIAYALALDSSGNVYVTGETEYENGSFGDCATVKYATSGTRLWVAVYSWDTLGGQEAGYDLAVDNSGNVFVTGESYKDFFTVKYNTNGNQLWATRYDRPGFFDGARALALDSSGNVCVTGYSENIYHNYDYLTIKYDADDGNQLWNQLWLVGTYEGKTATSLALDGSDNVYVTGSYPDYVSTIKYSPDGNRLWVKEYFNPDPVVGAKDVEVDNSGNVYITGWRRDLSTYDDYLTLKYRQYGSRIYVDADATGANNGSGWADAFNYLRDAIDFAQAYGEVNEIWVAQGAYLPDENTVYPGGNNDRTATFQLKSGVAIYGGFPSGGGAWESRDPNTYQTILSGDIGIAGNNSDNSYHVVTGSDTNSTAILNGFTITSGNANGYYNKSGGGMFNSTGSPAVTNCTFSNNSASTSGGGMYNYFSSPSVFTCTFSGNDANSGGGMLNYAGSPMLYGCSFTGNDANDGGGMYNTGGSPDMNNCIFNGNSAINGGGMYNSSDSTITNCTFSGNSATSGGGICNSYNDPNISNCILWGNTAPTGPQIYYDGAGSPVVSFSDIQDGWEGTGNIDSDPLFVDADGPDNIFGTADDNLRLSPDSPCIDAGDNNAVPEGLETDLDGRPRFKDDPFTSDTGNGTPPIVDMGAYEYQPFIYVDASATGTNNGSSWSDAYKYLQDALSAAEPNDLIWVAQGTYRPDEDTAHPSGTNDRTATLQLKNGVAIYGGFPAGGGLWESRAPNIYQTILSGDINVMGDGSDNCYHVVTGSGTDYSAILDGFTIILGNAVGSIVSQKSGGGMYNNSGSPTVTNCIFSGNAAVYGGGIYNSDSNSTLTNCTFEGEAGNYGNGGGMYNNSSSPIITNCTFSGSAHEGGGMYNNNFSSPIVTDCSFIGSSAGSGGGMYNNSSSPAVINCTFSGNSVYFYGGGMYNDSYSIPTVTDCTFSGNNANYSGGGMYDNNSSPTIINCILWGNTAPTGPQIYNIGTSSPAVSFSDVQGGWGGTGNIDADPLFVDANGPDNILGTVDDNLRLLWGSPCIDTGDNNAVPPDYADLDGDSNTTEQTPLDLDGFPRFIDGECNGSSIVDMGAYEYLPILPAQASNPNPANLATNVNLYPILNWTAGAGATSHLVYFGTNPTPGTSEYKGEQPGNSYVPGTLLISTTYYWRIDEKNLGCTTTGIVWMFTTQNFSYIYVDANATGANNGSSWTDAYTDLQDALTSAASGDQIWVAKGIYKPSIQVGGTGSRYATFQMKNHVEIYGGFPTGGGDWEQRNWQTYETILSGDIGTPGQTSDNSYHVFYHPSGTNLDETAVLDGFTITAGNGGPPVPPPHISKGGGMYNDHSSPTLTNCIFRGNSAKMGGDGGAMYNYSSSPTVTNCTFMGNSGYYSGGMHNENYSSPTLTNCTFIDNSAIHSCGGMSNSGNTTVTNCTFIDNSAGYYGGGMYNSGSPTVTNCTFSGNSADYGGGMSNHGDNLTVTNCTFTGNDANYGGGICNFNSGSALINCILWGNTAPTGPQIHNYEGSSVSVSFSDVQGGWAGTGNIDSDPLFVDSNNNLRLSPGSPCIDVGDNSAVPTGIVTDLDGRDRFVDGDCNTTDIVDMGAYEFTYAYIGDFDSDCDVDFMDYSIQAGFWMTDEFLVDISPPPEGDDIVDIYDLAVLCDNWLAGK